MNEQSSYISCFFFFLFSFLLLVCSCFLFLVFFLLLSIPAFFFVLFFLFFSRRSVPLIVVGLFSFFLFISFNSSIFLCHLRWCRVVMLKTVDYGNQVRFESLKNSAGTSTKSIYVAYIYILDTYRHNDKRRIKEDAGRLLYNYIYLSLYCKGSKGLFKVLQVRGCWKPNINFIFWPHYYDRHVVSFLFSWCWGLLHRGFPKKPSVGCGFPYHIWSLLSGSLLATAWHPELNWVK